MDGSSSKLGRMNIFLGVAVTLWIIFSAPFCEAVTITYSPPTECDIMNISWTGGQPPFVLNFITVYGAQSLQQLPSSAFTGSEGFYETRIPYPSGTLLLFILQDATGFPDGGTSDVISVGANVDGTTCYPTADTPNFDFKTDSYIQQCQPFNFFGYNDGTSQPITIIGMIPGAQVFTLTPPMGSTSFEWTASLPGSTTVLFTMVDAAGHRGAVTQLMTVEETSNTACLSGPSAVLSPTPTGKGIGPPCPSPTSTRPSWTSSSPYTSTTPSASASATHRSLTAGEIAGISVASAFGTLLLLGCVVLPISRRLSRKRKAIDPPPPKPPKVMTVEKVDIGKTEIGNVEDNRAEPNPDPVNRKTDPPPQDPWPGRNVNMVYIQNAPPQANWENKNTLNNWNPPKSRKTSVRTPSVSSQSDKVDPQPSPLPPPKCPSVPSCKNEPVITSTCPPFIKDMSGTWSPGL
ncbi:hypothetical protein GLOTRDRAFT_127189 [Gloeophyllum trabeum ATCC 11539]|uniref:Mid2 domain-containing protein n=1 Tax=Gloeophyllum trabeum (strain ATCC 11539 / FP-39264 / Madison 617) TaxID=670483 RepID=S7RZ30_GLOTA|nr:uncharacterized protein GLOTRDRAFT_127189 [Gloeophyllum trabeum ATCC 11539]EPQ58699.1 hypothetical protein GLOTRDRAFT_127189 [Gloeophyllum trabeum ATCC 11539]